MLVKCVCANCGHSFLTDDQAGELTCARCGFVNDAEPSGGFEIPTPSAPLPPPGSGQDEPYEQSALGQDDWRPEQAEDATPIYFNPSARPPVFLNVSKTARAIASGGVLTMFFGGAVGAAFAATGFIIPGLLAILVGLAAGVATRQGMGGRAAPRSKGLAIAAVVAVVTLGTVGTIAGSWMVERFTGTRASTMRQDLDAGKKELLTQLARAQKVGDVTTATMLDTRVQRVEKLEASSDAQLEDYLWVHEAGFGQPMLAYAKLRVMYAPMLKLGPDSEPKQAPKNGPPMILAGEMLLAMFLAYRGVRGKRLVRR